MASLVFSECNLFFRDSHQENGAVGMTGIMPYREGITEGHYILDLSCIDRGMAYLVHSEDLLSSDAHQQGYYDACSGMCFSEIARMDFVKLRTNKLLLHVYAREVFANAALTEKVIVFIGCVSRESMGTYPNETIIRIRDGSFELTDNVPIGLNIQQVLSIPEMTLTNGLKAYSTNNTAVDRHRRQFYTELVDLGVGATKEERTELHQKYYPGTNANFYIFDNEFIEFLTKRL